MDGTNQGGDEPNTPWEFKSGEVVSPNDTVAQAQQPAEIQQPPLKADTVQVPTTGASVQPAAVAEPISQPSFTYSGPTASDEQNQADSAATDEISWTASEFIAHQKSVTWYAALGLGSVVVAAVVYLLFRDIVSAVVVMAAAVVLGIYGSRQPRELHYSLGSNGLTIETKFFPYEEFRAFSIIDEGAFASIVFAPLKRFSQLTTIYYDPKDEETIVNMLADRLPMEERQADAVDRFMKRIRF